MNPDRSAAMEAFRERAMSRSPVPVPGTSPTGTPMGGTPGPSPVGIGPTPSPRGAGGGQAPTQEGPLKSHKEEMEALILKTLVWRLKNLEKPTENLKPGGMMNVRA